MAKRHGRLGDPTDKGRPSRIHLGYLCLLSSTEASQPFSRVAPLLDQHRPRLTMADEKTYVSSDEGKAAAAHNESTTTEQ
jgi:hypothetical protein